MKRAFFLGVFVSIGFFFFIPAVKSQNKNPALDTDLQRLVLEKRALVKKLGQKHEVPVSPMVWDFFDAVQKGDWKTSSNHFYKIEAGTGRHGGNPWMPIALWGPIHDTFGAYEQFQSWNPRLLHGFGNSVMRDIPAGSIYFGGTDAGRFIITALSKSHSEGRPFFTLTQNALADGSYLEYLRDIYGTNIFGLTAEDSQRAFNEYLTDARQRLERHQLKEGEEVQVKNNRVQVSGVVAVMAVNELLVKGIIDQNPAREIYLEESYPLESLYGQSLPQGLIFKVQHQPLPQVPESAVKADREFWAEQCRSFLGKSVEADTSVAEICSWAEKAFVQSGGTGAKANQEYLSDAQAPQYYSQCRSAIASYYASWSRNPKTSQPADLLKEADFSYRQAVSLSPYNPMVVWRYAEFLLQNQRTNDAKLLIETALKINPEKRMDIDSDQLKTALRKMRAEADRLKI